MVASQFTQGETAPRIGIMADSHGRYAAIDRAISLLIANGCRRLVHLGDICDSADPSGARRCMASLAAAGVKALKGNNDHSLARAGNLRHHPDIDEAVRDYLDALPVVERMFGAVFTHSRPFTRELGLSCMVGELTSRERKRFAATYTETVLFRGHGHSPEVIRVSGPSEKRYPLSPGQCIRLEPDARWVVTCGALCNGVCMSWQPDTGVLTCYGFPSDAV